MVYKFNVGYSVPGVSAQAVGDELDRLRAESGDSLTPSGVVFAARDEDSPLHPAFEWDDEDAAERYREDQARRLIRNVYPVVVDADGQEKPVLGYVSVTLPEVGRCYVTTARAMSNEELRVQVEQEAVAAFEALRRRYDHIRSLRPVFAAIDKMKKKKVPVRRREAVAVAP